MIRNTEVFLSCLCHNMDKVEVGYARERMGKGSCSGEQGAKEQSQGTEPNRLGENVFLAAFQA